MAKEFGLQHLAMPTNGNAGAAMADYGFLRSMGIQLGEAP
jgi:hypothetical protein